MDETTAALKAKIVALEEELSWVTEERDRLRDDNDFLLQMAADAEQEMYRMREAEESRYHMKGGKA